MHLSDIYNGFISTVSELQEWYGRSFLSFCKHDVNLNAAIKVLVELEAIVVQGYKMATTKLGDIAAQLYFHPADIYAWKENFTEIFDRGLEQDVVAVCWALSHVPSEHMRLDFSKYWHYVDEFKDLTGAIDLDVEGTIGAGLLWWSILGGPSLGRFGNLIRERQEDFGRIHKALKILDDFKGWNQSEFIDDLLIRVRNRIPECLVNLCKLKGIGKSLAYELYNMGIQDIDDMQNQAEMIKIMGSPQLIQAMRGLVHDN